MKYVILIVVLLAASAAVWAQGDGDSPLCSQVVVGPEDSTCNSFTSDCPNSDHGCQISTFTADCTGNYDIDAWLTATGAGQRLNCKVCVKVEENASPYNVVGSCILDLCMMGGRTRTCAAAAPLTAGTTYRISVCLTYCLQVNSCQDQCVSCTAHGCVRYATTAPCW